MLSGGVTLSGKQMRYLIKFNACRSRCTGSAARPPRRPRAESGVADLSPRQTECPSPESSPSRSRMPPGRQRPESTRLVSRPSCMWRSRCRCFRGRVGMRTPPCDELRRGGMSPEALSDCPTSAHVEVAITLGEEINARLRHPSRQAAVRGGLHRQEALVRGMK